MPSSKIPQATPVLSKATALDCLLEGLNATFWPLPTFGLLYLSPLHTFIWVFNDPDEMKQLKLK